MARQRSRWMTLELARRVVETGMIRGRRATPAQLAYANSVLNGRILPFEPPPERIEDYLPAPDDQARIDLRTTRLRERGRELAEELGDEDPMPNPRRIKPSKMDGEQVNIVVVRAHHPPGGPWWKITPYDRPAVTEVGEIVGTWTDKDYRGFGPDWWWVARSLSTGETHYIHPMDISWVRKANPRRNASGGDEDGGEWWEEPRSLREQMVLEMFRGADPHEPLLGEQMIRYGNYGWSKWEWIHQTPGGYMVTLHYWKTPGGERVNPKFKQVSPEKEWRPERIRRLTSGPMEYAIDDVDVPRNLREKLVYEIVMAGTQPQNERKLDFENVTKEPFISLLREGWTKWQHRHVSAAGNLTVVNFWKSKSGERLFPKFIRDARSLAAERHFDVVDPAFEKKMKRIQTLKRANRRLTGP